MRRTTAVLPAIALIAGLALSACGGSSDDADTPSVATSSAAPAPQTWPLTGLQVPSGESAAQRHPVMVLKLDNTYASSPQLGLGKADMVVEELVEGGLTRLAAFYYSQIPGKVGPVRSMRASDIGIVSPVHADVVTSGAAPVTIRRITGAGIKFFGEGAAGFFRDSARSAPYNLFTDMSKTVKLAETKKAETPPNYLPWGDGSDLPKGKKATTIAASFSGGHTTDWKFAGGTYANTNSYAASGDTFKADNVLVLRVQIGDAGYLDPAGNHVPETKLLGQGPAMLFHDGRMIKATWKKSALDSPIELSTKAGALEVPAGHTWIELVPVAGSVTFDK